MVYLEIVWRRDHIGGQRWESVWKGASPSHSRENFQDMGEAEEVATGQWSLFGPQTIIWTLEPNPEGPVHWEVRVFSQSTVHEPVLICIMDSSQHGTH